LVGCSWCVFLSDICWRWWLWSMVMIVIYLLCFTWTERPFGLQRPILFDEDLEWHKPWRVKNTSLVCNGSSEKPRTQRIVVTNVTNHRWLHKRD
jgi:hypothetical protein